MRFLIGSGEVLNEAPDLDWIRQAARYLDPGWVSVLLASLNQQFEDGMQDRQSQIALASWLFKDASIWNSLRKQLLVPKGERTWYDPSVGLYALRLLAKNSDKSSFCPGDAVHTDLLYKWLLHVAGFVAEKIGGPHSHEDPTSWVAWELGNWHVGSTENLHSLFARTAWLLFEDRDEVVASSPNFVDIEAELTELLGIHPKSYLFFLFPVYGGVIGRKGEPVYINLEWPEWEQTGLSFNDFEVSLKRAATDFKGLTQRFSETDQIAGGGPLNILPFAESPLLRLPNGSYVCSSIKLFGYHMRDGLYHVLWNKYRGEEGRPDNRFTRFWGELTESYVRALFSEILSSSGPMKTVWFGKDLKYGQSETEAVDVIAEYPTETLFIEVTSTRLTLQSMCLGDPKAIQRDLYNSIVDKAEQLDRCITDFRQGTIDFGEPGPKQQTAIVPVIITPGFTASFPPSQEYIRDKIANQQWLQQEDVLPLQVYSLGQLELIMNYAASGHSVGSLIARKARSESQAVESSFPVWVRDQGMGDPSGRHPLLARTFKRFFSDLAQTLFPGESLW